MIKVKTKVGDVLIMLYDDYIKTPILTNYRSIGKLLQLDKELEEFVDKMYINYGTKKPIHFGYDNYIKCDKGINLACETPKQSFVSLIKSQHPEFDESKEYLLIKLL